MPTKHRKRVKHFDEPGHCHELTFSCYRRLPLLTDDGHCRRVCEGLGNAMRRHRYRLFAFVLMPEHVHLLVQPLPDGSPISDLLRAIKRPVSYRIKRRMQTTNSEWLERLTIRQRPGVMTFRFWQEGPGYDRHLTEPGSIVASIEYIHANPVRRGLCQRVSDWKWSSARWHIDSENLDADLPNLDALPPELLDGLE